MDSTVRGNPAYDKHRDAQMKKYGYAEFDRAIQEAEAGIYYTIATGKLYAGNPDYIDGSGVDWDEGRKLRRWGSKPNIKEAK